MPTITYDPKEAIVRHGERSTNLDCGAVMDEIAVIVSQLHFGAINPQQAYSELQKFNVEQTKHLNGLIDELTPQSGNAKPAYIRGIRPPTFRAGEWARVVKVIWHGYRQQAHTCARPTYTVEHDDGFIRHIAISNENETEYEFRSGEEINDGN